MIKWVIVIQISEKGWIKIEQKILKHDVVVVGSGAAGVAAAIGAAQTGARTLLIERNPYFGGQVTHCSLPSFCGFFTSGDPFEQTVGGVGEVVIKALAKMGMCVGPVRSISTGNVVYIVEPEAVKFALDKVLTDSSVDVLLHSNVIGAIVNNSNAIVALICHDDGGQFMVEGEAFVDASGEANLTALSNGGYIYGGDGGDHLQCGTMMIRIGGVQKYAVVDSKIVEGAVIKGKEAGILHLSKEHGIVFRLPKSGDVSLIHADEYVDGTDALSLTQAEISGRRQAWAYLEALRTFASGFENAYIVSTGPKIGVRETRHIIGDYTLSVNDLVEGRRQEDAIARAGWPGEAHPKPGIPTIYYPVKDNSFYDIPLRALKVQNINNLWAAGRIISSDMTAFVSIRVMGTGFATGHAAGVAAALHVNRQKFNHIEVQKELRRQGAII